MNKEDSGNIRSSNLERFQDSELYNCLSELMIDITGDWEGEYVLIHAPKENDSASDYILIVTDEKEKSRSVRLDKESVERFHNVIEEYKYGFEKGDEGRR